MPDTTPLTGEQLAEIEARHADGADGPWGYYDGGDYVAIAADYEQTGRGSYSCRQNIARLEEDDFWDDSANEDADNGCAYEQMIANAEFITKAREDVPALLAEVRRLRAVEVAAYGFADEMGDRCDEHGSAAHHCDAQRLRDRLQQAGGAA